MASTVNPPAASDKLSDLELRLGRLESVRASVVVSSGSLRLHGNPSGLLIYCKA